MTNLKTLFEILHVNVEVSSKEEIVDACKLIAEAQEMTSAERDVIRATFYNGPLYDGDIPSKTGRDSLLSKGFITKVVVKGEDGFNACTSKGAYAYNLILFI